MKSLIILLLLSSLFCISGQDLGQMVMPGSVYHFTGESFSGSDSTFRPTYWNGNRIYALKGIQVRKGCDSAIVVMHLRFNDTEIRYECWIDEGDIGKPLPIFWDKIYQTGTTVWAGGSAISNPLDSLSGFPESK